MENVVIISGNAKASEVLITFFKDSFKCNVKTVETAAQAYNLFNADYPVDLAVINTPLQDENSMKLAEFITEKTAAFCMILVKSEIAEKITEPAEKNGIIVISKPFSTSMLYQSVYIIETAIHRYYKMYEENTKLKHSLDDIKLTDKAKFLLMQYKNITEEEAHEYLQQYAMNNHLRKIIAASEIIDKLNEQFL